MCLLKGDLDILTSLLTESEDVGDEVDTEEQEANPLEQEEDFDSLFDDDNNEEEEYKESVGEDGQHVAAEDQLSDLFGDVDDIEIEEEAKENDSKEESKTLNKSREDLQGVFLCFSPNVQFWLICPNVQMHINVSFSEELRRMQEQMQRLQQQLEASQKGSNSSLVSGETPEKSAGPKPVIPDQSRAKSATASQKTRAKAGNNTHLVIMCTTHKETGSCLCKNVKESLFPFQQRLHPLPPERLSKSPLFFLMN